MERLRRLLAHIGAQLRVLSVSQRLAVGLCAALAAVSVLWLLQWSTQPDMVPLVRHEFGFDDLDAAEAALRSSDIAFEVRGTRIYVPPVARHNALRVLHGADALPEGSLFDMAAVVAESNPFQSPEARTYAQTYAKGNELAKIIATSPFVKAAAVIINPITKRRLGGTTDVPTASVTVTLASGREFSQEMVEGFAKLVAGAVGGLKPHLVYITDARTLRSYSLPHPDDAASFDVLSMIQRREEHYRAKILNKLADIPGIQVAVTVELDLSKRVIQNVKHDIPQPRLESTSSAEQSSSGQPTEAGVQANLGQALTAGGSGPSNSTEETRVENFAPQLTQTETIEQFPFATRRVMAAIGLPRSFVVGVYRALHPEVSEDPKDDDPAFAATRAAQVARVKSSVERIVMAKDPDDVVVDVYPDMEWTADGGVWSRAPGGVMLARSDVEAAGIVDSLRTYAPQAGLVALAVASLVMMMRMVRKSSDLITSAGTAPRDQEAPSDETQMLTVGPATVGQAERSDSSLIGLEIGADDVRFQELGKEVSKMVEQDPRAAADLIRQWVDEDQRDG